MPKLHFKFREDASEMTRQVVIRRLLRNGVRDVHRLFPSERDKELGALFVAEVEDETKGREILGFLSQSREVEFAEPEARRKLIR